jgi:hypothetical protein
MFTHVVCLACACSASLAVSQEDHWQLATDDTQVTLRVRNDRPVVTRLAHAGSAHDWSGKGLAVPLVARAWVHGREFTTKWRFQKADFDGGRGRLVLVFANDEPRLTLRSIWLAQPGAGPVRHRVEIDNGTRESVTVGHQDSLTLLGLVPQGRCRLWWIRRGGGNATDQGGTFNSVLDGKTNLLLASNCDDGASAVPWMAVQMGSERGLYVGWEFSGLGRILAQSGDGASLDLHVGNHPNFKTDLGPGRTLHIPAAFVGCYAGDLDEGSYRLHRFVLEKLRPPVPKGFADPTLAYNLYLDAGGNKATEADVLRSARFCHDLGFETFMPDAMWFPETGDWRWDPRRFPGGIGPIEDYVHRNGMKLALWCAWTNGGVSADPAALSVRGPAGRPEWFSETFDPKWMPGPFYGGRMCLGCDEAREWAAKKTQWLVAHHRLDYLKHDCGPIVTACTQRTHRHRHGVDVSYWATLGYYDVYDRLLRQNPGLVLENCSGGGHIKDFGIIQRTHYTVTTDTLSNLPDRHSIYDSTFAFPPVVLQAYTYDNFYPVKGDNPGPFLWRSAMMGAWQIDPTNTPAWSEAERESARRAAAIYKQWVRPLLADVKVHHILPRPDGKHWDGMFYWNAGLKKGTVYVFRPDAAEDRQTVRLKGLDADAQYWFWCEDDSLTAAKRSGADLMNNGLTLTLPRPYTSDLIYLQDAALGKPEGLSPPGEFRLKAAEAASDPFAASARLAWESSANARSYRVVVARTADFTEILNETVTTGPGAALPELPGRSVLHWKVEAIGWGGRRWNEGTSGRFETPGLKPLAGVTFVSDMKWLRASAGAGNEVRRDTNYHGNKIRVGGKTYVKGLWTHSFDDATPADVIVDIADKNYSWFAADAGLDEASNGGSVEFQVLVDGKVRAKSPVMRPRAVHAFRVDVKGARQVTLRVLNGGDGYSCDHAAWGWAWFVEAGRVDPLDKGER